MAQAIIIVALCKICHNFCVALHKKNSRNLLYWSIALIKSYWIRFLWNPKYRRSKWVLLLEPKADNTAGPCLFRISQQKWLFFKKWRYDCRSGNCNFLHLQINPQKNSGTSTGLEPMASTLALQCPTNWATKTHTLGASQFVEFILIRERNEA